MPSNTTKVRNVAVVKDPGCSGWRRGVWPNIEVNDSTMKIISPRPSAMTRICIFLFVVLTGNLNAQNYQNICNSGTTFYKNNAGNVKAFRLDSVFIPSNNDTIFISYRTIRPFQVDNCYDTTNGSILGREVYKKSDGTFYFFNRNHDSIAIKTQAELNQTWKFCDLPDSSMLEARIANIYQDTVLGSLDLIKAIVLMAKDKHGDTISHFLNLKTIFLSRNHGISKAYDFYFIPDLVYIDTSSYGLYGTTEPPIGSQNLSWKNIYDFEVDDEFHWSGWWNNGSSWQIIKRVLGKTVYGDLDSVRYTMEYCKIMWLSQPPPNVVTYYDTITEFYNFIQLNNNDIIQKLPEEFCGINYGNYGFAPSFARSVKFNGRQVQNYCDWCYSFNNDPFPCWQDPFIGEATAVNYSEGLGKTYTFYMKTNIEIIMWSESLVYFKKGSEVWGTPVASDCSTLGIEPIHEPNAIDLKIIPNPIKNQATINIEGVQQCSNLRLLIYNSLGAKVLDIKIPSNSFVFNRNFLPSGIYVATVIDETKSVYISKKLLLE